jgi:L-ascorbate metabolism protein UlaG (beta-lactamase superfamily)
MVTSWSLRTVLKVYLSGDTGQTSDMLTIVHGFYRVNLAVVNMDGVFVMGPEEAAYAVRTLIQPKAVIVSHATENATMNGAVQPGTRTARFLELLDDFPVFVPLSGRTMEFDGEANCLAGCKAR